MGRQVWGPPAKQLRLGIRHLRPDYRNDGAVVRLFGLFSQDHNGISEKWSVGRHSGDSLTCDRLMCFSLPRNLLNQELNIRTTTIQTTTTSPHLRSVHSSTHNLRGSI